MESYENCSNEDLLLHALKAMKKAQDIELTGKNIDLGIVGKDKKFTKLSEDEIQSLLDKIKDFGNNNTNINRTNNTGMDIEVQ